jgi:2-haloacid dehalogenase
MSEIRHIVFDIGRVLIHYDPNIPFSRIIPDEQERRWFFEHVCTHEWNLEQDRGRKWEVAEAVLITRFPDHAEYIRAFRRHWHEMVPHAYEDTASLMERLIEAGHDVTMLTNFAADTFAEARQRFPFLNRPRGVTVSAEVGHLKPEPEIYRIHAEACGIAVHRRQPRKCRGRAGGRVAGGPVRRRRDAGGGPQALRDRLPEQVPPGLNHSAAGHLQQGRGVGLD